MLARKLLVSMDLNDKTITSVETDLSPKRYNPLIEAPGLKTPPAPRPGSNKI